MKHFDFMNIPTLSRDPTPKWFSHLLRGNTATEFFSILRGWSVLLLLLTLMFLTGLRASDWLGPLLFSPPLIAQSQENYGLK